MKKFFIPLCVVLLLAFLVMPAFAEDAITVKKQDVEMDFPKQMTFTLDVSSVSDIQEIELVARFAKVTRRLKAKFAPAKDVNAKIEWNLDTDHSGADGGYLPPGVSAEYTWIVKDAAGNTLETAPQTFTVDDNRIDWDIVENDDLAIHWYGTGKSFGRDIFNAGIETLGKVRAELGAGAGGKMHIWYYTDDSDFQTSMPDIDAWVGGRSFGEYRVIILNNSPINVQEAIRGARHELTHQVIFDSLGGGLARQAFPHWLNEGFATYNEHGDASLADYLANPLRRAISNDALPRLKTLNGAFPPDSNEALLAYAVSYSMVDLLFKEFGQTKVQEMYKLFQQGTQADDAFRQVFGMNMDGLDNLYRKSVGLPERDLSQTGFFTPEAAPTFALSSAETPAPKGQATATPQPISKANTPAPAVATTIPSNANNSNNGNTSTGLCGIGLGGFALAMFGAYEWRKRRTRI